MTIMARHQTIGTPVHRLDGTSQKEDTVAAAPMRFPQRMLMRQDVDTPAESPLSLLA